jgi:leader peptidase (prepilin peptidase)/N-methyltransferase
VVLFDAALAYAAPPGRYERRWQPSKKLYPVAEALAFVLVAACFLAFGLSLRAAAAAVFCAALVVVTTTDLEFRIVPNRVVLPASAIVLALDTAWERSPKWALAGLAASGFLFLAALVSPQGMGMGDVKLAFLIGVGLGWAVVPGLVVGLMAAAVPALLLLVAGRGRKTTMPLAPFLALGAVVALFAGV